MVKINKIDRYLLLFRVFAGLLPCLLGWPLRAQSSTAEEALKTFLSSPSLEPNQTVVYIWDIEADYRLADHRAELPVVPASVMKCVTTGALSAFMPYSSVITTNVYLEGILSSSIFTGRLIVEGAGDPSLGDGRHREQTDFPAQIADALKKKGITSFKGEIVIDNDLFAGPATHPSWMKEDILASYGTGIHAFNFEGNASGKKAIANPDAVFRRKLITALSAAGIEYTESNQMTSGGKKELLTSYSSPSMGRLMQSCMFRSDNLYAEAFLRLFGIENGTDGSTNTSARALINYWDSRNLPVEGVEIVDGSGLSRDNRLTAEFLGLVLEQLKDDPEYVSFFPLVGEEGTVRNFLSGTPLQGYMALKTGSMRGVQSYAGYVLDEDFYPTHVVVVMTNGLKNRETYKAALAKFFLTLFT